VIKVFKLARSVIGLALLTSAPSAWSTDGLLLLEGAWVRALPPTQSNTAAYLTLINNSDRQVTVTGAYSPVAQSAEIHTSREVDGLMRMEQLQQLPIAAGTREALMPGGKHLMLLGLDRMPMEGERVELCFTLARGEAVCTAAEVRRQAASNGHQHH
jgi:copper(I)-binding protein